MDRSWYARFGLVVAFVLLSIGSIWPTFEPWMGETPEFVSRFFHGRIARGLDIQGGLRLMYEVEVDQAVEDRRDLRAQQLVDRLCQRFGICTEGEPMTVEQRNQVRERVRVETAANDAFRVIFTDATDIGQLDDDMIASLGDLRERTRAADSVTLALEAQSIERLRETAVDQARNTISERIDTMGTREASVMSRDTNIVVELPGADAATFDELRAIIARTARLEFKVCDDESSFVSELSDLPAGIVKTAESVRAGANTVSSFYLTASGASARDTLQTYIRSLEEAGTIPDDHQLAVGRVDQEPEDGEEPEEVWRTYYLYRRADVTGDAIDDAAVGQDPDDQKPYVQITFNSNGASAFDRLTGANVNRRMAIVLDDRVETAPNIQQRIGGGRASITLGGFRPFNELLQEANDLVVVLRAGALPAPIRPANEQLIGPSLGEDAVRQGVTGALIGVGLVLVFMALYYQVAGLVADVMVVLNLLFLFASLAFLEATLTLPGIAGVALTVGMAVDANVLITERMREELHLGKSPRVAVERGFDKAFSSIFDSQLTTFISGVVLYQYGTGPLKGFAVTLMVGIATSLFTGVFCSKVAFDWLVRGLNVQKLRVG